MKNSFWLSCIVAVEEVDDMTRFFLGHCLRAFERKQAFVSAELVRQRAGWCDDRGVVVRQRVSRAASMSTLA
jgi:hypothetical protein